MMKNINRAEQTRLFFCTHLPLVMALYLAQAGADAGDLLQGLLQLQASLLALNLRHGGLKGRLLLLHQLTRQTKIKPRFLTS